MTLGEDENLDDVEEDTTTAGEMKGYLSGGIPVFAASTVKHVLLQNMTVSLLPMMPMMFISCARLSKQLLKPGFAPFMQRDIASNPSASSLPLTAGLMPSPDISALALRNFFYLQRTRIPNPYPWQHQILLLEAVQKLHHTPVP